MIIDLYPLVERIKKRRERKYIPHKWFAWRPVRIDSRVWAYVWLQTVLRCKHTDYYYDLGAVSYYTYSLSVPK